MAVATLQRYKTLIKKITNDVVNKVMDDSYRWSTAMIPSTLIDSSLPFQLQFHADYAVRLSKNAVAAVEIDDRYVVIGLELSLCSYCGLSDLARSYGDISGECFYAMFKRRMTPESADNLRNDLGKDVNGDWIYDRIKAKGGYSMPSEILTTPTYDKIIKVLKKKVGKPIKLSKGTLYVPEASLPPSFSKALNGRLSEDYYPMLLMDFEKMQISVPTYNRSGSKPKLGSKVYELNDASTIEKRDLEIWISWVQIRNTKEVAECLN